MGFYSDLGGASVLFLYAGPVAGVRPLTIAALLPPPWLGLVEAVVCVFSPRSCSSLSPDIGHTGLGRLIRGGRGYVLGNLKFAINEPLANHIQYRAQSLKRAGCRRSKGDCRYGAGIAPFF